MDNMYRYINKRIVAVCAQCADLQRHDMNFNNNNKEKTRQKGMYSINVYNFYYYRGRKKFKLHVQRRLCR